MEIERKFLIQGELPFDIEAFERHAILQGYLCTDPVLRIRRTDDEYTLTYKGGGLIARDEYNLPFSKEGFERLLPAIDGCALEKDRYLIPFEGHTIELDVFHRPYEGLVVAEVEFESLDECNSFTPPEWFGRDVSEDGSFHNSSLCKLGGIDKLNLV